MSWKRTPVRRKIAAATWRAPRDGRVYVRMEVDVTATLAYAARVTQQCGVPVSVMHVAGAALARVLREVPEIRSRLVLGRLVQLEHCDIAFAVDIGSGSDLAPVKVLRADTLTPAQIAAALIDRAQALRTGSDAAYSTTSRIVAATPAWGIRPVLKLAGLISGGLGRPAFGQPGFPLGSAFVSNVGSLGLDEAFLAPLPFARTPVYLAVGAVRDRPAVVDGQVLVRPTMVLVATADHRLADGAHAGQMVQAMRRFLAEPELLDRPATHEDGVARADGVGSPVGYGRPMTETVDPRNNPESQQADGDASQTGSRTSLGGAPPTEALPAGQTPQEQDAEAGTPAGTGQGNPLAGVLISDDDLAEAVPGDTGPEHPGARRDSGAGHA